MIEPIRSMNHVITHLVRLACIVAFASPVVAQDTVPPAAMPAAEAAALAEGWTFVAQGRYDDAAKATSGLLARYPRSTAALSLVIEIDIARRGADGALASYEAWLGGRPLDQPGVLRRVARAYLHEWGRQTSDVPARRAALQALVDDGDPEAGAALSAARGPSGEVGGGRAVDAIVARMNAAPGLKLREVHLLADTGSPRAVAPLVGLLRDPQPENRAAAAEALGTLGGQDALEALRPLLEDPHGVVRIAAAGALFKHGDSSGAPLLQELAASDHVGSRRSAALLMANQPDEAWKALVRGLASDPDPSIQLDAARLLAPHDPDRARAILDRLANDASLAIREGAALALSETPISDFPTLRRLLRAPAGRVKVRAAGRILALTR
jgi:HEAT repeat protein